MGKYPQRSAKNHSGRSGKNRRCFLANSPLNENCPSEVKSFSYKNVFLKKRRLIFTMKATAPFLSRRSPAFPHRFPMRSISLTLIFLALLPEGRPARIATSIFYSPPQSEDFAYSDLIDRLRRTFGRRIVLLETRQFFENPKLLAAVLKDDVRLDGRNDTTLPKETFNGVNRLLFLTKNVAHSDFRKIQRLSPEFRQEDAGVPPNRDAHDYGHVDLRSLAERGKRSGLI